MWRIMLLEKSGSTNKLDYVDLIINYVFEGGIYGYPYLKHLIGLWPWDWVEQL